MPRKRRKEVAADLNCIYQPAAADEVDVRLGDFEAKYDDIYLLIVQSWLRNWIRITPFFDFPSEIRKVIYTIYTINAIKSVNISLRNIS